jgi:acyl-CoA reductase-like NAD-dependent aldehyde dehydrogenase
MQVLGYVKIGQEEGARLVCGGKQVGTKGYYVQPTIFADVTNNMRIAKEEVFGPFGVFMRFGSMEEAVSIVRETFHCYFILTASTMHCTAVANDLLWTHCELFAATDPLST